MNGACECFATVSDATQTLEGYSGWTAKPCSSGGGLKLPVCMNHTRDYTMLC